MVRRRWLLRALAAGVGAGIAGCLGGDESPDDSDGGGGESPDNQDGDEQPAGVEPERAQSHYDDAIAELVAVQETLDDWAAGRPGRDQRTIDTLQDDLESARESLDEAADVAPDDLAERIDNARNVADFQEAILEFYEAGIEFEEASADAQAFGDTEQHERAIEQYQQAKGVLEEARSRLEDVEAAHERVDSDTLDEPRLEFNGEYTRFVDGDGPAIEAQELLVDGQIEIHRMFVELNAGFEQFENEEFAAARERFVAAEDARQRAAEAFEAVQEHDGAWSDLREESIQLLAVVEDLAEALELFVDAAREGEAGNHEEAAQLAEEGFFVMEEAFG